MEVCDDDEVNASSLGKLLETVKNFGWADKKLKYRATCKGAFFWASKLQKSPFSA